MTKGARPWEVRQHRMDADFPGHGQSTHVWWMRFQQVYAGEGESGGMARDSRLPLRLHSSLIADMMMRADVLTDDQDFAPDGNCSCLRGNRSSAWLSWSCRDVMHASAVMVPLYQIQFFLNSIETACTGLFKSLPFAQSRPASGPTLRGIVEVVAGFQPATTSTIPLSERRRREEKQ